MALRIFQFLFLFVFLLLVDQALFRPYPPPSIHIHFDEDGRVYHKEGSIKLVDPIGHNDKFLPLLVSKPLKKLNKYHNFGKLTDSWKSTDNEKKEVVLEEPFRPVSIRTGLNSPSQFDDVKPVTEHIEDDIKYDFRTMMHSI